MHRNVGSILAIDRDTEDSESTVRDKVAYIGDMNTNNQNLL
jgi:hypothetical protein